MATTTNDVLNFLMKTTTETSDGLRHVPVYGLPGYRFYLVHICALVCLCSSLVISAGVLVYLLAFANEKKKVWVWSRPIGERLVIYLASFDFLFSISHIMDHSYLMATLDHPPDAACATFAFILIEFVVGQALIVVFTSVNAFVMVVKERKINLGKYDWKLMLAALGIPCAVSTLGVATGSFGQTGFWCVVDMRKPAGPIVNNLIASVMMFTFLFNVVCYLAVYIKIRHVAAKMSGSKGGGKYHKSAKVMMLFVGVYILQWWSFIAYSIARILSEPEDPHIVIVVASVTFSNLGGAFNFIVLKFVRKKQSSVNDAPPPSSQKVTNAHKKTAKNDKNKLIKSIKETTSSEA